MSALDGGTWGLGEEFDRLSERLFKIAEKGGVRLSMRVRGNPGRFVLAAVEATPKARKPRARKAKR